MTSWPAMVSGTFRRVRSVHAAYMHSQDRHFRILVTIQAAYFLLLFAVLILTRNWPTPDQIGIALFLFALISARPLRFLRDWFPFIFLVLSYELLRGLSTGLMGNAHIGFPITADRAMFGTVPTIWLQDHLWDPNHLHWYDYVAAFMHPLHFIMPLAVAFVLWMKSPKHYWKFVGSYLLLTYAGLVTYILYPMAPPWYASNLGRLPPVTTILDQVLWQHSVSHPLVFVYNHFDPNPVAAMPSLHAAFPVLVLLVCVKLVPRRLGWLAIVYPLLMDFSVVYMGEHYVTDCIAGTIYGAAAYYLIWELPNVWQRWRAPAPERVPERQQRPLPGPVSVGHSREPVPVPVMSERRRHDR